MKVALLPVPPVNKIQTLDEGSKGVVVAFCESVEACSHLECLKGAEAPRRSRLDHGKMFVWPAC